MSAITLAVDDLNRAKHFYNEGLACPTEKDHGEFASLSLGTGSSELALYRWEALADDAGVPAEGTGFRGFSLSYIVESAAEVDAVIQKARRAGGTIVKPAKSALWGGYSGYVSDPDGHLWKVASDSGPGLLRRGRSAIASAPTQPRESIVTVGVDDIKRARSFYGEGLGCPVQKAYAKFVSFDLGEASSGLALYTWDALAKDAGVPAEGNGFRGFTLSYVAESAEQVDAVMNRAAQAGGRILKAAEPAPWGGYSGYFADPDGYLWKVAAP